MDSFTIPIRIYAPAVVTTQKRLPGDYRFYLASHPTAECGLNTCPTPAQSGMLYDRMVTGAERKFHTDIAIPFAEDTAVIEITRAAYCDDGTFPQCDIVVPECDPTSELLAYQNNCYNCVNPVSCKPWGASGCESDDDCARDEFCDSCRTSSCPACDDCIGVCWPIPIIEL